MDPNLQQQPAPPPAAPHPDLPQPVAPQPGYQPPQPEPPKSKKLLYIGIIVAVAVVSGLAGFLIAGRKSDTPVVTTKSSDDSTKIIPGSIQSKVEDVTRKSRINSMYSKLEEYYNNQGNYPITFDATILKGIDAEALQDPSGTPIRYVQPVASLAAAKAVAASTEDDQMQYIPYGCDKVGCQHFILRAYIANNEQYGSSPYTKLSLN